MKKNKKHKVKKSKLNKKELLIDMIQELICLLLDNISNIIKFIIKLID